MSTPSPVSKNKPLATSYRIIGVGNAGVNFLDRLLFAKPSFGGLVALNNDSEALAASVIPKQIGLAPDLEASKALAEVEPALMKEIDEASLVVLTGGLGGSVASHLLPELAARSKAAKKITLACVSLPFSFEGKRVQGIAAEALTALQGLCDGVFVLDNNALCSTSSATMGLGETFTASDEAMQNVLPALLALFFNKGPVRVTRADLLKALSRLGSKTHFGYGQAVGPNRLHEAVERALKNPLLDRGRFLAQADAIFVLLRGPKNFSFAEAQAAMQEIERFVKGEHDIQLSVTTEEAENAPLQLFLLAVAGGSNKSVPQKEPIIMVSKPPVEKVIPSIPSAPAKTADENPLLPELFPKDVYQYPAKASAFSENKSASTAKPKQTQGALNLTAAQRGRFDKSEPTIVEGEDLDTPTYLRLGIKLS